MGTGTGTRLFALLLALAWVVLAGVTGAALVEPGLWEGIATFVGDLGHPWRAQFNSDLAVHALLAGTWIAWRHRWSATGIACGVAAVLLGAVFTLAYVLVALLRADGDVTEVLLGKHD